MNCNYETCNEEAIDGKKLCEFHAPIDEKTISADEFSSHINQMINKGNLDFQGYVFSIPVEIHNKAYNKNANFHNAVFYKQVQISSTQFNAPVLFVDVEFKAGLKLTSVNFGARTDFTRSRFTGSYLTEEVGPASIYCEQVTFHSGVGFVESEFQHQVYFRHCRFHGGETNFFRCVFEGGADFSDSLFQNQSTEFGHSNFKGGITSFSRTKFESKVTRFTKASFLCESTSFDSAEFNKALAVYFNKTKYSGTDTSFRKMSFDGDILQFNDATFESERTDFSEMTIRAKEVNFSSAKFYSKSKVTFEMSKIDADIIDFSYCQSSGKIISFKNVEFESGLTFFQGFQTNNRECLFAGARFKGSDLLFNYSKFYCQLLGFNNCHVGCSRTSFEGSEFGEGDADFSETIFRGDLIFRNNSIRGSMLFCDTQFGELSVFHFHTPKFNALQNRPIILLFIRVRFNSYKTFFEQIIPGIVYNDVPLSSKPNFIFRYCYLKEIFLSENDMSMFSFYRCAFFEEAFFTSSQWPSTMEKISAMIPLIRFARRYAIHEDIIFSEKLRTTEKYSQLIKSKIENNTFYPTQYSEIAELYIRYKSAADKSKDYNLASWFYFNEIEMKRRQLTAEILTTKNRFYKYLKIIKPGRRWLYSFYRIFAGYGEKPVWSFIWFCVFTSMFTFIHLLNGIKYKMGDGTFKKINYKLTSEFIFEVNFSDFLKSLELSISRVIPSTFLPGQPSDLSTLTNNFGDFILSLANSVFLALMVIFVAIGLKRHFRRF